MITAGLLAILLAAALGILFIFLTRFWTAEMAFTRLSWIPLAALVLEVIFTQPLVSAFSYSAVAFPVLTGIASLLLTLVGVTLVVSARQRHEAAGNLFRATVVASLPGALLAAYVFYAWLAHAFQGGA